jgi:hypothetical protein
VLSALRACCSVVWYPGIVERVVSSSVAACATSSSDVAPFAKRARDGEPVLLDLRVLLGEIDEHFVRADHHVGARNFGR